MLLYSQQLTSFGRTPRFKECRTQKRRFAPTRCGLLAGPLDLFGEDYNPALSQGKISSPPICGISGHSDPKAKQIWCHFCLATFQRRCRCKGPRQNESDLRISFSVTLAATIVPYHIPCILLSSGSVVANRKHVDQKSASCYRCLYPY